MQPGHLTRKVRWLGVQLKGEYTQEFQPKLVNTEYNIYMSLFLAKIWLVQKYDWSPKRASDLNLWSIEIQGSRLRIWQLSTWLIQNVKYQRESKFQIWICDALNIEMHHGDWIRSLHPFWAKKLCFLGQKTLFLGQKALFLGQFLTDKRVLPSYCNLVFNSPVFCTGFYYGILQSYIL